MVTTYKPIRRAQSAARVFPKLVLGHYSSVTRVLIAVKSLPSRHSERRAGRDLQDMKQSRQNQHNLGDPRIRLPIASKKCRSWCMRCINRYAGLWYQADVQCKLQFTLYPSNSILCTCQTRSGQRAVLEQSSLIGLGDAIGSSGVLPHEYLVKSLRDLRSESLVSPVAVLVRALANVLEHHPAVFFEALGQCLNS